MQKGFQLFKVTEDLLDTVWFDGMYSVMFLGLYSVTNNIADLDTVLTIADSLIKLFWPADHSNSETPSVHGHLRNLVSDRGIEKDISAFCFTFYVLLMVGMNKDIIERRDEVREVASSILKILEGDTKLATDATWDTYMQLREGCRWVNQINKRCGEAMDAGLLGKLQEISGSIQRDKDFDIFSRVCISSTHPL